MQPELSKSLLAKAWFSLSIRMFSCLLTEMLRLFGPTDPDLPVKLAGADGPNYDMLPYLVRLLLALTISRTLLGAKATLLHLPHEISTNLFNKI